MTNRLFNIPIDLCISDFILRVCFMGWTKKIDWIILSNFMFGEKKLKDNFMRDLSRILKR